MGIDAGGRSWLATGHKEANAADSGRDTRWMGPGIRGWPAGSRTRNLPPWRWRTDPDRTMTGQAAADGLPVLYSPAERQQFRECHELLLDAEATLSRGFKLGFDKESVAAVLPEGGSGKPFASPMYWAPFVAVGAVDR